MFAQTGYHSWCFCHQVSPGGTFVHGQVTIRNVSVHKYHREIHYHMARLPFVLFLSTSTSERYIITWPGYHSWCFCPQVPPRGTLLYGQLTIRDVSVPKYHQNVQHHTFRLPFVMFLSSSTTERYVITRPGYRSWCFSPQVPPKSTSSHVEVTICKVSVPRYHREAQHDTWNTLHPRSFCLLVVFRRVRTVGGRSAFMTLGIRTDTGNAVVVAGVDVHVVSAVVVWGTKESLNKCQ